MRSRLAAVSVVAGALVAYAITRRLAPAAVVDLEDRVLYEIGATLARFEGFRGAVYQDQAGRWTIGFGHLIVPGDGFWHPAHAPDGRRTISVEEARALKQRDAQTAIDAVDRCVTVPLTENQRTALVSLAYNIGAGAFCGSRVVRLTNAGDYAAAADAFRSWNKVTDPDTGELVVSAGLVARREQEREIFLS